MTSLKEVKSRIASVSSTKKITQARQMIASAQLHHAQGLLEKAMAYKTSLDGLLSGQPSLCDTDHPLMRRHSQGVVGVVIMSSNSGMCGAFNANMVKILHHIDTYYPDDEVLFFPIGKKIRLAIEQAGCRIGFEEGQDMDHLAHKGSYPDIAGMASYLMDLYRDKKVKQVDLIYYQYKNMAIQEIKEIPFLPYTPPPTPAQEQKKLPDDPIFEPTKEEVADYLIPLVLKSNLYYTCMENQTSEHASRTMAMQLATENADALLGELQLTYNKLRQQTITSELLDIIGGSFA